MENSKETGKAIGALVVVALLGAVAGILFAPDKGSKTRAMLAGGARDMADDLSEKVKEEAKTLRNRANELKNMAGERVSEVANNVKSKIDEVSQKS